MATPSKINLSVNDTGIVKYKSQDEETAKKTSELLQENHDNHHIFFNASGFHNHIAHHLLTLYGLGASSSVIQAQYNRNASYQRPAIPLTATDILDLRNPEVFTKSLGKEKHYHAFLLYFQSEMNREGWENVLNEYVFKGDQRADDLLGRMYAGFLHPLIHLGFGIEFHQPAIIAEALAQACVHDKWTGGFLLAAEKAQSASQFPKASCSTLPDLLDEIRADEHLSTAAHWSDNNKIRDGILARAPQNMLDICTKWVVTPENLQEKTVEMINNAIYFTAAAQNPPKQIKFDFYYMHCVNASIFSPTLNAQSWLPTASKVRLLQWKGWLDLAMYASRRSPHLLIDEIENYVPRKANEAKWSDVFNRVFEFEDDGHAVKLARAVRNGEIMTDKFSNSPWCKIKGPMFDKIGNMVIDSVEDTGEHWARSVGFAEAWAEYKDRPSL